MFGRFGNAGLEKLLSASTSEADGVQKEKSSTASDEIESSSTESDPDSKEAKKSKKKKTGKEVEGKRTMEVTLLACARCSVNSPFFVS